ncbi:MAG: NADH-quinone oxidoreductase subunit C [Balneolaceae bacterium]
MKLNLTPELKPVIDGLAETFGDQLVDIWQSTGHTFVRIVPDSITSVCRYLHDEHRFIYLSDLFGADRFTTEERFEVIYNLLSLRDRHRLFIKTWLEEENPVVDSVVEVWPAANWFEREVFDMFGVRFNNHPDLRRIYMPEDYEYYPLRKEFPLLGVPGSIDLPGTTPDME